LNFLNLAEIMPLACDQRQLFFPLNDNYFSRWQAERQEDFGIPKMTPQGRF